MVEMSESSESVSQLVTHHHYGRHGYFAKVDLFTKPTKRYCNHINTGKAKFESALIIEAISFLVAIHFIAYPLFNHLRINHEIPISFSFHHIVFHFIYRSILSFTHLVQ